MTTRSASRVIKRTIVTFCRAVGISVGRVDRNKYTQRQRYRQISARFRAFTMIPEILYVDNLQLAAAVKDIPGDIVECGVWRGGMIAGIAELLGNDRKYWLFDSFEGLPPAQDIDGTSAIQYQKDPTGEWYFDNCTAEQRYAQQAMTLTGRDKVEFVKGWFKDTVATAGVEQIALLRLDGDWYESTMTCLEALYPKVSTGGIIIIDDYHTWDGCSRAVHDFLSRHALADRIQQSENGNAFLVKRPSERVAARDEHLASTVLRELVTTDRAN